jgi:hypothetical protein
LLDGRSFLGLRGIAGEWFWYDGSFVVIGRLTIGSDMVAGSWRDGGFRSELNVRLDGEDRVNDKCDIVIYDGDNSICSSVCRE